MQRKLAAIPLLLSLAIATPAQAEIWSCLYNGDWSTFNSTNKGKFNWSVVWQGKSGGSWKITGDYSDRYGNSVLNGSCNNYACNLTQVYQSGELKGNKYFWKGQYTDETSDSGKTINRFEGTWGETPKASDGPWQAIATCTKN